MREKRDETIHSLKRNRCERRLRACFYASLIFLFPVVVFIIEESHLTLLEVNIPVSILFSSMQAGRHTHTHTQAVCCCYFPSRNQQEKVHRRFSPFIFIDRRNWQLSFCHVENGVEVEIFFRRRRVSNKSTLMCCTGLFC